MARYQNSTHFEHELLAILPRSIDGLSQASSIASMLRPAESRCSAREGKVAFKSRKE